VFGILHRREAEAAVGAAEADVTLRERDFARHKQMYADKAITKEEYDRVEGAHKVSQAQLRRANEQVSRVQVLLSYTRIQATADGIVANRFALQQSYAELMAASRHVRQLFETEPGVVDVDDTVEADQPKFVFHVDKEKASLHGVSTETIAATVRLAFEGHMPGEGAMSTAGAGVLQLVRLLEQRIVVEVNLTDGQVVRRAPVGVQLPQQFRRERAIILTTSCFCRVSRMHRSISFYADSGFGREHTS